MAGGDITWRASLNDDPFRNTMDKIVGLTDQKGKMVLRLFKGVGGGLTLAAMYMAKGLSELGKVDQDVKPGLDRLGVAWHEMWARAGEGAFAAGVLDTVTAAVKRLGNEIHGAGGIDLANAFEQQQGLQREYQASQLLEKEKLKTLLAQAQARKDEVGAAKLQAKSTLQSEQERINAMAKEKNLPSNVTSALLQEAKDRYNIAVETADINARARDDQAKLAEQQRKNDAVGKAVEVEQSKAARYTDLNSSLDIEREMLGVEALKRKGLDERAALEKNEIDRKKALLELARDELLTASDLAVLKEKTNTLFDARGDEIRAQRMGQKGYDFKAPSLLYDTGTYRDLYGYQGGGTTNVMVEAKTQTMTQKQMLKALESMDRKMSELGNTVFQ